VPHKERGFFPTGGNARAPKEATKKWTKFKEENPFKGKRIPGKICWAKNLAILNPYKSPSVVSN